MHTKKINYFQNMLLDSNHDMKTKIEGKQKVLLDTFSVSFRSNFAQMSSI